MSEATGAMFSGHETKGRVLIVDDEPLGEGHRLGFEFTNISRKRQGDLVNAIFHLEVQRAGS